MCVRLKSAMVCCSNYALLQGMRLIIDVFTIASRIKLPNNHADAPYALTVESITFESSDDADTLKKEVLPMKGSRHRMGRRMLLGFMS